MKLLDKLTGNTTVKASEFTLNITYFNPEEVSSKTGDSKDVKKEVKKGGSK